MSQNRDDEVPPAEVLRDIVAKQDAKEREIKAARKQHLSSDPQAAAELIQRNYRGYRARRELQGYTISASERWAEAVKDAQYYIATKPSPKNEGRRAALDRWSRARAVAARANSGDDMITSNCDGEVEASGNESESHREHEQVPVTDQGTDVTPKSMGIEYFLEMVDTHHRYGSNLRAYQKAWLASDTTESFFWWLDYGEGKDVDLEERPRTRLDTELVRYLSKEERKKYLVIVDEEGMLCWAKNGERVNTSPEYRDSIDGIVPTSDHTTPTWRNTTGQQNTVHSSDDSNSDSDLSVGSNEDASRYTNQELHNAKGLDKFKHLSAGSLMNSLLRKTTKKNTWIFVVDLSFRMYIGIKQSGAFQHSSFLHGGRVAAAGLIRIKRGQLRRLSPLSGHYAPPAKNFQQFVHKLRDDGVDMTHVSISRSYAVLVGLEGYLGAKRGVKKGEQRVKDALNPEEAKKREEEQRDKSNSAQKEKEFLEAQAAEQQAERRRQSVAARMVKKLQMGTAKEG